MSPAFHLRNREAQRSSNVSWNGNHLENTAQPKYLGVTLDRTLSYRQHIHNTKIKVATRNNFLRKLANMGNKYNHYKNNGTGTVLINVAQVWVGSSHADILDPKLNKA